MHIIDNIIKWFKGLFVKPVKPVEQVSPESKDRKKLPPVIFSSLVVSDKPPRNDDLENGVVYCINVRNKPKWSMFICPCGCRDIVTLSLQEQHRPHWKLSPVFSSGRPTLVPSVWRDTGCLSHFWIKDGRVFWCNDTGSYPGSR